MFPNILICMHDFSVQIQSSNESDDKPKWYVPKLQSYLKVTYPNTTWYPQSYSD